MKSTVASDGELIIELTVETLARLRAYTREVSGKEHPTMSDVKKLTLAAYNAFCPKGGGYPKRVRAKRVTFKIS